MPRQNPSGRLPQRAVSKKASARRTRSRLVLETLEARNMLAAQDLLVGFYDTGGVGRYNEATQAPAAGAVAPGYEGLTAAAGVAVAPDGTFYVSQPNVQEVYHFSNSGLFLGYLGQNDADPVTLESPGALAFGPDGNLYVADLGAGAVYQFNVNSATQQYQAADTTYLTQGYPGEFPVPGGIAFAANGDLIVGDLGDGSVADYHDGSFSSYYIDPFTSVGDNDTDDGNVDFLEPAAILAESNGNLLIADVDYDYSNYHHQIVQYNASNQTTSTLIDFSNSDSNAPIGYGGLYSQPVSLLTDQDGNLLVGVSPDGYPDGAVLKYNISTGAYMSTVVSGIDTPAGLAYIPSEQSDLLVSDYDQNSVLRYDDQTDAQVPGGVASSKTSSIESPAGVAVAPDGSYYVSNSTTQQVLHYSSAGLFLGYLGQNDADPVTLESPGALAFGPDGNLYVADLGAGAVYQFNVNSATQQYQAADTTYLTQGYPGEFPVPGGIAFAANGDLIVGDLGDGSVADYHDGSFSSYYIDPFTSVGDNDTDDGNVDFLEPAAILAESNGNLLIADVDYDYSNYHHQIVQYNASNQTTSTLIDFSNSDSNAPIGYGGLYSQPVSLLTDQDGNLLVGVSPDGYPDGAVLKYNISTGAYMSTVATGLGTPSGLAMIPVAPILTTSGGTTGYTAGGAAVAVDAGLTLSDANALPDLSATVTIGGLQTGDTLNFTSQNGITGSYSGGVLTLSGNATAAQYQAALQSVSFSSTNTSTSPRTISFTVTDGTQSSLTETKTIDVSAPATVTGVYIASSSWSSSFLTYLGSHSEGSSTYGYAIPTGSSAQLQNIPWTGINQITISFSEPVTVSANSLKLSASTGTPTVSAPVSDGNNTYTWTVTSGSLTSLHYLISVASTGSAFGTAVTDANGAGISGAFSNGSSSLPSGNGLAGGAFNFEFEVDLGAATGDAAVSTTDVADVAGALGKRTSSAGYSPFYDYLGTGTITTSDVSDTAALLGKRSSGSFPSFPAATGTVAGTDLALGAIETTSSTSSTSSTPAVTNVASTASTVANTSSTTSTTSTTSSGSTRSTGSSSGHGGHGQHFAATDAAVGEFDLADLWA